MLASLNHPDIGGIYDLQEAEDSRFLVLEMVEGETLAERIRRGPLPVDEALHIAKSICEAVEAAHEKGVVHRDLKPANTKITPDGAVKVLDDRKPVWTPDGKRIAFASIVLMGHSTFTGSVRMERVKSSG